MATCKLRFGVGAYVFEDFEELRGYTILAEKLGFDSVWVVDQVYRKFEALTTLAAIAADTSKIRLGTCVVDPNRRNPATLAQMISTVDRISRGRFILGVGKGHGNENAYGLDVERPVSRMRESIQVMRRFWTEPSVTHDGTFFKFKNLSIPSEPFQKPYPPIWIAAFGPRMMKIAAELGTGYITSNLPPNVCGREIAEFKAIAGKLAEDREQIELAYVGNPMAIAREHDDALRSIETLARQSILALPARLADRMGYNFIRTGPKEVPLKALEECYVFGTVDECIARIEAYTKIGIQHMIFLRMLPIGQESLRLFAEKVMGYFRS